jgi:hypothetical protein
MSTQPEALRLADDVALNHKYCPVEVLQAAATELRRLHASCEDYAQHKRRQDQRVLELAERVLELKAQRDALLEALKYHQEQTRPIQRTLDVIKAVEETK